MGFANTTDFQDNYYASNNWSTTLSADLGELDTVIYLSSVSGLPPKGWVTIDNEHIYYDYIDTSANTLGDSTRPVERGVDGSTAAFHATGSTVEQRINAAAFNTLMSAVKKRRNYILSAAQVAASTASQQNLTGFAGRARIGDLRIVAVDGSQDFVVEFYSRDTFRAVDRIYKTVPLSSVETTLSQNANAGDTNIYVNDTTGFVVDELVVIGAFPGGSYEYGMVKEVVDASHLVLYDAISGSYAIGDAVTLVHRDQQEFYYEDLDWTAELHVSITNNDGVNPITVHFDIIAETSDE